MLLGMGGQMAQTGTFQIYGVNLRTSGFIFGKRSYCTVIVKFSYGKQKMFRVTKKRWIGNTGGPYDPLILIVFYGWLDTGSVAGYDKIHG